MKLKKTANWPYLRFSEPNFMKLNINNVSLSCVDEHRHYTGINGWMDDV